MAFKSIFRAFRGKFKPGVSTFNPFTPSTASQPVYNPNENTDPISDNLGSQWVRQADNPLVYFDEDRVHTAVTGNLTFQRHTSGLAVPYLYIGQGTGGAGVACALFKLWATSGDGTVEWDTAPVYLQAYNHAQSQSAAPLANGAIPAFVWPVPQPSNQLYVDFGLGLPMNGTYRNGGLSLYFSSTRDTLTAGPTGVIMASWAYYDVLDV